MPGAVLDDVGLTSPVLEPRENAPAGDWDVKLNVSTSPGSESVARTVKTVEPTLRSRLLNTAEAGRLEKVGLLPAETVAYTAYSSLVVEENANVPPTLVAEAPELT